MGSAPLEVLSQKIEEMKETSANRDFSNGSAGAGVTAASAIYALQESGNKVSRDSSAASYRAYTRVCRLCLALIRQFYDEARAFRAAAAGEEQEFVTIGGQALRDQPSGTASDGTPLFRRPAFDIRIAAQKHSPFSTAAANERALQLYNAGFFDPRRAAESLIALEMMEFEGKEAVMERIRGNLSKIG